MKTLQFLSKWYATFAYGMLWWFSMLVSGVPYHDPMWFYYATKYNLTNN